MSLGVVGTKCLVQLNACKYTHMCIYICMHTDINTKEMWAMDLVKNEDKTCVSEVNLTQHLSVMYLYLSPVTTHVECSDI